jgi:DNA-3-methyladenine glycosylase II
MPCPKVKLMTAESTQRSVTTISEDSIEDAILHLASVDNALAPIARSVKLKSYTSTASPFESLVHAIIYQQLSGRSAGSVYNRFLGLYGGRFPTPDQLLQTPNDTLRQTGMSLRKTEYIKEVAMAAKEGRLKIEYLMRLPDEKIIEVLDRIRGVGPWTVQMLLIFLLGRVDVFPASDLGLRKAIAKLYGLNKIPTESEAEELSLRWRPYRSVASILLWRSTDTTPWP